MKVNEILSLSCEMVGCGELKEQIEAAQSHPKIDLLLQCLNLAYEEVITEYLPISCTEVLTATHGEIKFSEFSKPVSGIQKVEDLNGKKQKFSYSADHINVGKDVVRVRYQIYPSALKIGEEFDIVLPARVLAYGTAREYYFMQGMSDEALVYDKRFIYSIANFVRKQSVCRMKGRKWVS